MRQELLAPIGGRRAAERQGLAGGAGIRRHVESRRHALRRRPGRTNRAVLVVFLFATYQLAEREKNKKGSHRAMGSFDLEGARRISSVHTVDLPTGVLGRFAVVVGTPRVLTGQSTTIRRVSIT